MIALERQKAREKSTGQTLEDFDKTMEEIKPYLPPRRGLLQPKYEPWKLYIG